MKKYFTEFLFVMAVVAMVVLSAVATFATTANPSPASPGYTPFVIPIMGTYSSNSTPVSFKAPVGYRVLHASATAKGVTGTDPTLTVDVRNGSTSVFSAPISITAGAITDAVLSTSPLITDEGTVNVVFTKGGSYTSGQGWSNITLFLWLKRR
ncbi:MAG: hypothetical protein CVU59_05045 [Deltaproteobacteria bacterium HGW-Deltaproteobacteria-17]|nr:MAG: hypothetical protein CVU59_05045 [Deltaproteobacteria bacterium HGW-Deltaproteobacteria-17]